MEKKVCSRCKKRQPVINFNWRNKKKGTRDYRCRTCWKTLRRIQYERYTEYYKNKADKRRKELDKVNFEHLITYLRQRPCIDCGETDVVVLEFDHVKGKKKYNIAKLINSHLWSTIQKEIAKCEVRCRNCHMRKTARDLGYRKALLKDVA